MVYGKVGKGGWVGSGRVGVGQGVMVGKWLGDSLR